MSKSTRFAFVFVMGFFSTVVSAADVDLGYGYARRGEHILLNGKRIDQEGRKDLKKFGQALGRRVKLAENVDAATFRPFNADYAKDKNQVYYRWTSPGRFFVVIVPGADAATFQAVNFAHGVDHKSIWYLDQPVEKSDPFSFVLLDNRVIKDRQRVYVSGQHIAKFDAPSFKFLGAGYFADNNNVYWGTDTVQDADPGSFEVFKDSFFARDNRHCFLSGKLVPRIDAESAKLLLFADFGYQIVSDKNGVYLNGMAFLHAKPDDFKLVNELVSRSKTHTFYVDIYHCTPVTVYRKEEKLIAETVLYEKKTKTPLATIRGEIANEKMENITLSPAPGAKKTGRVPTWQRDLFARPALAKELQQAATP